MQVQAQEEKDQVMPMLVAKSTIDDYLDTSKFDSWDWVKRLEKSDILEELDQYAVPPQFKTEPYTHQLQAFFVGSNLNRFAFFMEMGLGKSKTVIDIVSYMHFLGEKPNTLVIANNAAGVYTWVDEIQKHSDLSCSIVLGDREEKRDALERGAGFHVATYDSISSYATVLRKSRSKKKKGRKSRQISKADMKELSELFDVLVLDELHNVMNPSSLTSRVCLRISVNCDYVYGLTGTPMGRDPSSLFGEMLCVDNGETFGDSVGLFNAAYYEERLKYGAYRTKAFDKKLLRNINKRLKHRSLAYTEDECFDVPNIVKQTYRIPVSSDMRKGIDDILVLARQNKEEMKIRNSFHRLRQMTGGNLVAEDEEGKVIVPLTRNPKVEALIDLLGTFRRKVIVFYEYNATGDCAEHGLDNASISYVRLWGETKKTDRLIECFNDPDGPRVLLTNSKSGGTSLNLQASNYVVYLESPVSPIIRNQSEKRIRPRMHKRSFVYDLVMRGTVDEKILAYLAEGKDLFDAIIKGKVKLDLLS